MRPAIAVDFDGTIYNRPEGEPIWETNGDPINSAKEALEVLSAQYEIIIFSCRTSFNFGKEAIEKFMHQHGIPYSRIAEPEEGKVIADFYIDDRAITFDNNWKEIVEAL